MKALKEKGLAGDVDRIEIIMQKGAIFKEHDYIIKGGYVTKASTGERVTIANFSNFIMVIQL